MAVIRRHFLFGTPTLALSLYAGLGKKMPNMSAERGVN